MVAQADQDSPVGVGARGQASVKQCRKCQEASTMGFESRGGELCKPGGLIKAFGNMRAKSLQRSRAHSTGLETPYFWGIGECKEGEVRD